MEKVEDKLLLVLGATGSVGKQTIDAAEKLGMKIEGISANRNIDEAEALARRLGVKYCAMADEDAAKTLKVKLSDTDIKVMAGQDGICEMIKESRAEIVENSILGEAGLMPTLAAISSKKRLALANKESLVVAGDIVMKMAKEYGCEIVPVDSEHCAIHQCLRSGRKSEVKRLILTASGGPFFGYKRAELEKITPERALAHPTWNMGAKITVDSATLMNKGFEVIEAAHLFGVGADRIKVLVHRESIIHSMVEYIDNSISAQLSVPDMRFCAQYAITYPERICAVIDELDLAKISKLTFAEPDTDTFTLLPLAFEALKRGGATTAVLNASDEVAVSAFLAGKTGFCDIFDMVEKCVSKLGGAKDCDTLDGILYYDREARALAGSYIKK